MAVISIPKILRDKFGEEIAEAFVELFNKAAEERFEKHIIEVKSGLELEIEKVRTEIVRTRADIIKWVFIFIFGQFWAIIGVLFAFFRK